MRSPREPWKCARCSTLNLSTARSCRRCGNAPGVLLTRDAGSPGLAAVCSGLVPGLGQLYQERWIRGAVIFLVPVLAIALGGALIATVDPLTSLVIGHAVLFTVAVIGGMLLYHLCVVADAFAGGLRHAGSLRGKHAADYFALAIVTLAAAGKFYLNAPSIKHDWMTFVVLAAAATVAQVFPVKSPRNLMYHTSVVFLVAAALLLPPELIVLIPLVQTIPEWLKERYP